MNLKEKKHWLFDMDGTLTQAMHDFDAMRAQLGLPAGVPILEALDELDPTTAARKHQELDAMELDMASKAEQQPGALALLVLLQQQGSHLGIVTRNGKEIALATLQACGLAKFFNQTTIISRDCCKAKPDPEGIHLLLERWQACPQDAVMVGDYLFDLQAGRNAGVSTVHMDTQQDFLWPEMTDLGVSSLHELQQQIADS